MGKNVSFGSSTRQKIRYTNKTVQTISNLFIFFKTHTGWQGTRNIKSNVKLSNTLLWQLSYQGYISVKPKKKQFIDVTGQKQYCQSFLWKADLKRFQQFINEANVKVVIKQKVQNAPDLAMQMLDNPENFEEGVEVES